MIHSNLIATATYLSNASVPQPIPRSYPPLGIHDTVHNQSNVVKHKHGDTQIFEDHEIVQVIVQSNENTEIAHFEHEKAVIQQQASRSCTAAVTAMLIADHYKIFNWEQLDEKYSYTKLQLTNMGDETDIIGELKEAGLKPKWCTLDEDAHRDPATKLAILEYLLKTGQQPVIVDITTGVGRSHVIIVDTIDEAAATIRDPYHGWMIKITREALQRALKETSYMIQVEEEDPAPSSQLRGTARFIEYARNRGYLR